MSHRKPLLGALATLSVLMFAGCAAEAPPRSFVQPNAIKKSDLEGTYYYLQTVTDAPPTNGAMFIGQSSNLMKIRFDVQEDFLYARRAFEQIDGSEDAYVADPVNYKGAPLAAWRITNQFDVIRDFNSTTGEQTNRIIESTERPWNQREFIRVDWSQNLVTDYVGLGIDIFFGDGNPQIQPVSYWESDPSKPDAMHLEHLGADRGTFKAGELVYMDVTNQLIVTPENLTITFEEGGQVQSFTYPRCFFSYQLSDCASQRVKVRHAFAKIDPVHQYEPRDWDGQQMQLFGVWDVGLRRLGYNRDYGVTNSGASRHAARFNIWENSCRVGSICEAQATPTGDVNFLADGKVVATWKEGDAADPWTPGADARDTRLPWKQRKLRQIPYYAEGSLPVVYQGDAQFPDGMADRIYPPELYPMFVEVVRQWDEAMKDAVAAMYESDPETRGQRPTQSIFVACHSPVRAEDPAACAEGLIPDVDAAGNPVLDRQGRPVVRPRQGDPRRSTIFWVNQQQDAGPLGYGPPMYDEQTGETISGQAYIYGAAVDTYVARSRDLLLLQNGEIDAANFVDGRNVIDAVTQNRFGSARASRLSEAQVEAMAKAMDFDWAKAFTRENGYPELDPSSVKSLKASMNAREKAIHKGYFEQRVDTRESRLARLVGSPLEKMMSTPEMVSAGGVSPMRDFDAMTPTEKMQASPLRRRLIAEALRKYRIRAETRGVDFAQFDDSGIANHLSKYLKKYGNKLAPHSAEILRDLRADIFLGVTLHEMGHNVGCRHNFRGSYDSMNYFPDYWKLRTEALQHRDPGMDPGDNKLHPRYVNKPGGALTQHEIDGSIRDTMYSSIMDYGSEFNTDLMGLGLYDKAFMKFSYGKIVEVFTDAKADRTTQSKLSSLQQFQDALGFPSALGAAAGLSAIPYQSYPDLFKSGHAGIYKRANVGYGQLRDKVFTLQGDSIRADKDGHPLVPYYFCSDEFAGNLTCQRFDSGADAYEQASDIISRYQNFYIMNNFKRDRATFHSSLAYLDRIEGRYFDPLHTQLTWYVLLRSDFESYLQQLADFGLGDPNGVKARNAKFFVDENGWGNFTAGVTMGFDLLGKVITTPSAGWHIEGKDGAGDKVWTQFRDDLEAIDDPTVRAVPLIDGKYIDTTWDFGCGYYWADECQKRIGYFVDKTLALDVLSWSQAYFTGRDTSVDVRRYAIGYVLPFKKQLEEKLGAIMSDDTQSLAPYFKQVGSGANARFVVQNPGWAFDDPTIEKTEKLDPATGFTLALYAGAYALSSFPSTFDHEFLDQSRIFVLGNGEAVATDAEIQAHGTTRPDQLVTHGGDKDWLLVKDPTGRTFAARAAEPREIGVIDTNSTDAASAYETKTVPLRSDIGVRMLERLKRLSDQRDAALALDPTDPSRPSKLAFADNEFQKFRQNIEVMRSLQNAFGYGPFMTDAPFYY